MPIESSLQFARPRHDDGAGVPGAVVAAHELPELAVAAHVEMGRDLEAADALRSRDAHPSRAGW